MNWTSIFTTQTKPTSTRKRRLSLASLSLAVLSGIQIVITSSPTQAQLLPLNVFPPTAFPSFDLLKEEDFATCAAGLQGAGLSPQLTAQACAMAVRPTQISTCVTRINSSAGVSAEEALLGCVSVRRPEQMATCVVDITFNRTDANPLNVLDSCSRSLLPENHAFCVLGLTQSVEALPVANALDTCLTPPEQFIDLNI
ncbi:MAG: hypothetical protein WBA13_14035 [Microcoleaceae cyanobacterium]